MTTPPSTRPVPPPSTAPLIPINPMVSHPHSSANLPLAIRRPASTSSRSGSTTRRHRSSRSHHGGGSYLPQNDFPVFAQTGDVEIVVSWRGQEKRYVLHRLILAQCSGFFEASLSEEWSRRDPLASQRDLRALGRIGEDGDVSSRNGSLGVVRNGQRRWRYELDGDGLDEDEVPILVQKVIHDDHPSLSTLSPPVPNTDEPLQPPSSTPFTSPTPAPPPIRPKPQAPALSFFRSLTASQSTTQIPSAPISPLLEDYDNLFLTFYNHPPTLSSTNITTAYTQCKSLLHLADVYDALPVVGPRIDHHLLQFQSRLWKQIAKYPPSYLKLGYLARSKVIYAEALIHVVGQWPQGAAQLHSLPDAVLEVIEDKVADLQDLVDRTEAKLFRLSLPAPSHPAAPPSSRSHHNHHHHPPPASSSARVTPFTDYLSFLALSLFRHWLAEATQSAPPSNAAPKSQLHWLVGRGGPAYLPREELKKFLKCQPEIYSRENLKRFERRVEEVKEAARGVVKGLMKSDLELDVAREGGGMGYFVCTKVRDDDFCW